MEKQSGKVNARACVNGSVQHQQQTGGPDGYIGGSFCARHYFCSRAAWHSYMQHTLGLPSGWQSWLRSDASRWNLGIFMVKVNSKLYRKYTANTLPWMQMGNRYSMYKSRTQFMGWWWAPYYFIGNWWRMSYDLCIVNKSLKVNSSQFAGT